LIIFSPDHRTGHPEMAKLALQIAAVAWAVSGAAMAQTAPVYAVPFTADNFVRAESDLYLGNIVKGGGLGKFVHRREPAAVDNQTVVRLNCDPCTRRPSLISTQVQPRSYRRRPEAALSRCR
jgi:hypothetical protein